MCIAYGLNWLYFDVDNTNLQVHAIRRSMYTSLIYGLVHLPFIMVSQRLCLLIQGITFSGSCVGVSGHCE
jgi:hypothetical protein